MGIYIKIETQYLFTKKKYVRLPNKDRKTIIKDILWMPLEGRMADSKNYSFLIDCAYLCICQESGGRENKKY